MKGFISKIINSIINVIDSVVNWAVYQILAIKIELMLGLGHRKEAIALIEDIGISASVFIKIVGRERGLQEARIIMREKQ